ncbi:6,7-dimethyl-8-ribityllumazine synthase [Chlamydiota bacterium]
MSEYFGTLISKGKKYAIVVSRFNEFITKKLLEGCLDALERHGVSKEEIDTIWCPGSFEIPAVAKKILEKCNHDAIICLGAVIRGETPHFDFVAAESAKGIAQIGLQSSIPIINGIITTESIEHAIERAGTKLGNKGAQAALNALEMVNLYQSLQK